MLFSPDCPAPAFTRIFRRRKQLLGVRVRDDQLAFRVREQDGIGDGVDDAVQEHALLSEARFRQRITAHQARRLPGQHGRDPVHFRPDFRCRRARQQQTERRLRIVGAKRDGVETSLERRAERLLAVEVTRLRAVHRLDQRMRLVFLGQHEVHDGGAGDAVLGDDEQLGAGGFGRVRRRRSGCWSGPRASRRRGVRKPGGRCWREETPPVRASHPARWPRPARPVHSPRALASPRRRCASARSGSPWLP